MNHGQKLLCFDLVSVVEVIFRWLVWWAASILCLQGSGHLGLRGTVYTAAQKGILLGFNAAMGLWPCLTLLHVRLKGLRVRHSRVCTRYGRTQ